MWELDYEASWALKNWCFWSVVLQKTLESPLDCKEIQPVHPKGDQSWVFIGRTDAEAATPVLWLPDAKSWLIGKDPDAGRDWGQEEKETTGWDGWMASPTRWTWVWVCSKSWWWTGRPGVLWSMRWQRVTTERLNWTESYIRSLIHSEFIFVYGVRECSDFVLLHVAVWFSQHHFLKRFFSHCLILPPLSEIMGHKCVRLFLGSLSPLMCVSAFVSLPHCFDDCSLVV